MLVTALIMAGLALAVGLFAYFKDSSLALKGLKGGGNLLL